MLQIFKTFVTKISRPQCRSATRIARSSNDRDCSKQQDAADILLDPTLSNSSIYNLLGNQAQRSVIIEKTPYSDNDTVEGIQKLLKKFGKITYASKIDTLSNHYLVEFADVGSTKQLLYQGKDGAIDNHMVSLHVPGKPNTTKNRKKQSKTSFEHDKKDLYNLLDRQETISDQMYIIADKSRLKSIDIRLRYLLIHIIEKMALKHFGEGHKILPFGSSMTGSGNRTSDLDLTLVDEDYQKEQFRPLSFAYTLLDTERINKTKTHISNLKKLLLTEKMVRDCLPWFDKVEVISEAQVPIIKFRHQLLNMSVDLSVNGISAVNIAEFINWCIRFDPQVSVILTVVRKWATSKQLLSHGMDYDGVTPFMLQLITLVFLMRKNILPSMSEVCKRCRNTYTTVFTPEEFRKKREFNEKETLEKILCDFFEYFAKYGLTGRKFIPWFGDTAARVSGHRPFWIGGPTKHNVAQNCSREKANEFHEQIKKSSKLLGFRRKKLTDRSWGLNALLFD